MKKIIISDSVDKKSVDILSNAGFDVTYKPGISKEDLKQIISEFNGLIVRSDTKVTSDLISLMKNMEVIGRAGTGVDNIDVESATRKGIVVMNTPGGNTISAAEHTISLMLSMCRNIPQADASMKNGKWERKKFQGTELYGKTIGIIGLGKIGREVAIRLNAFNMNVIGYDPILSDESALKIGVKLVDLITLFSLSDIITLHIPLDEKTKNLISKENLSYCKDGVKIINCARGGIINESDLVEALNTGKVSASALDVYEKEPPDFNVELFKHSKVVTTPHLGASTEEAQEKVAVQIAEQIVDYFKSNIIKGAVNATALESFGNNDLVAYLKLAETLGSLQAQLFQEKIKKINLYFYGEVVSNNVKIISTAFLKGFLSVSQGETINLINAPFFAKEIGINIDEIIKGINPDYSNLITAEFISESSSKVISGTVFGNKEIRIVQVDEFHLELKPEGYMLFYINIDKPGVLAKVGNVLASNEINIAGLSLGRLGIGKEALTVITTDNPFNNDILKEISSINGIKNIFTAKI